LVDIWHLDELFVNIRGQRQYLWRAVGQDGDVIDVLFNPVAIRVQPNASFAGCGKVRRANPGG
jgi:hypothetical protein